jgi:hypothetical protein
MAHPIITGGCQCGAVRYRIEGALGRAGICHCRMCQKAFGSWGAALVSVPVAQLTWTRGQPSEFRSSAIVARGFCAQCGTPLHMKEDGDPTYEIAIGSLDEPERAPPSEQAGVEAELSWFKSLSGLPRQATDDYRSPEDMQKLRSLQHPDFDMETWPTKR